ncbi:MAG: MoaD/ThiS family protein [Gammaproteobacteria bacterium]|nr:MoaD/ThiS family protein [Gammaproteobacteria bacterium]MDH4255887.1 MoaD/ThiS family protein [Gammaproteobacteria bacterium]MDH5310084.1 MoaD/ThiS family protein [Gammaproteobacteria bacterium]
MIRVVLPFHLQTLANCEKEITLEVEGAVTQRSILDALEAGYPMLRGTVREHVSLKRRPRVRFFADGEDVTHDSPDAELPESIATGAQPFMIVGAVAGG